MLLNTFMFMDMPMTGTLSATLQLARVLSYYYRFYFEETPVIIAERGHHLVST